MKPIIVPAHTYDPDEGCICPYCENTVPLIRKGNRLVCPNGHEDADVLILVSKVSSEEKT